MKIAAFDENSARLADQARAAGIPVLGVDADNKLILGAVTPSQRLAFEEMERTQVKTVDDIERIKAILAKSDEDITAGELKELVLKYVRKRI